MNEDAQLREVSDLKKVAILQSNYIPWKGYFDIIRCVDEFILYDDVQYTHSDWRNRNKIMTKTGPIWLTIPVDNKGKEDQKIREARVSNHFWVDKHKRSLINSYSKAPCYSEVSEWIFDLYDKCKDIDMLSEINYLFISEICMYLGIETKLSWSMDYELCEGKTERLVKLVRDAGGGYYLSGPAAKDYIEKELFDEAGIELAWMDYGGYPEYTQMGPAFEHGVSILDMLFNLGKKSVDYIKR